MLREYVYLAGCLTSVTQNDPIFILDPINLDKGIEAMHILISHTLRAL